MITKLTVRTRNPYTGATDREKVFPLTGQPEYICTFDGLGPVKATINTVDTPLDSGGLFLSAKDGFRNIVMTVEFNANYVANSTVGDLRRELYKYLMPHTEAEFDFEADGVVYRITGKVETHEPVIFTDKPSVSISIICVDPYFKMVPGAVVTFDIPKTGPDEFSYDYEGDVPVGFILSFGIDIAINDMFFTIYPGTDERDLGLTTAMLVGDQYEISTVKGDRFVTQTRDLSTRSILGKFNGSLVNTKLYPGTNWMRLNGREALRFPTITYERLFGGL